MRCGLLLLTACWSSTPGEPRAPEPPSVAVEPSPSPPRRDRRAGIPRHSVWEGTYVCNQGMSSVTLTLDVDRSNNATARYDFGPVPSNPTVPVGSYMLTGALAPQGSGFTGELEPAEWIVHPPNYFMVPVTIETFDGKAMTATIRHPSCREFAATRIQ